MEVLVIILAVVLLVEVIVFSWIQVSNINKRIDNILKIFDIQFKILELSKIKLKELENNITCVSEELDATQDVLQNTMDTHDRFVDFVKENCIIKKEKKAKEVEKKNK